MILTRTELSPTTNNHSTKDIPTSPHPNKMTDLLLVSTDWLSSNLSNVIVLDGSWHMPLTGRSAHAEFLEKHIPGARRFDIEEISDHETNLPHMKPGKEEFERAVGALGITKESHGGYNSRVLQLHRFLFRHWDTN